MTGESTRPGFPVAAAHGEPSLYVIPVDPRVAARFRSAARAAGAVSVVVGALVLLGWLLDVRALKGAFPSLATMKANAALGLVLAGLALLQRLQQASSRVRTRAGAAFAAIVVALGAVSFVENVSAADLGIDQLIASDHGNESGSPGRMAPATSLCLALVGLAVLSLDSRPKWRVPPSQLLAGPVLVISLLTLLGYLYGVRGLYAVPSSAPIALHTALSLSILAAGVFFARPERGPMAIVSSNTAGGIAGRRLLPALIFVPIAWGWIRMEGQRAGLYGTQFGVAFLVSGNVVALFVLGLWSVRVTIREETTRSRSRQEAAARDANLRSAERFRDLVQRAPIGINVLRDGKVVFANPAMSRMLGYDDPSELVGLAAMDLVHPDEVGRAAERLRAAVEVGVPPRATRCLRRDGSAIMVESVAVPAEFEGKASTMSVSRDVTAELEADGLREQFRLMIDGVRDYAIFLLDLDGRVKTWNRGAFLIKGYEAHEIIGHPQSTFYLAEDQDKAARLLALAASAGRSEDEGWRMRKDGSRFWAGVVITSIRDAQGRPSAFVKITRDLSERKRADDDLRAALTEKQAALSELRRSEEIYRAIAQHLPKGAVFTIDRDLRYVAADGPIVADMLRSANLTDLVGRRVADVVSAPNKDAILDTYSSALRGERRHLEIKRHEQFFDLDTVPIFDGEQITHALVFLYDVTARKRQLAQVQAMLHEIHHRVKNNLQMISSLLNLQARQSRNQEAQTALRDAQSRVRTIALLHESLYQSSDLGRIDMQEYVGKLLLTLQRAYGDARVRFVATVDRIFLPVDVAVPCGLIANELLTNALKHAFADESDATSNAVRVEMRQVGQSLTLSVADNGRGFSGEVDPTRDETMGLALIRDLSGQLRGQVEFVADGGARCTVTFPTPDRGTEVRP